MECHSEGRQGDGKMFEVKEKELLGGDLIIERAYNDMCVEQKKSYWQEQMYAAEGGMRGKIKIGEHSNREKERVRTGGVQQHTGDLQVWTYL
jgi:hypothetical protein